jgi:hypothetical protein
VSQTEAGCMGCNLPCDSEMLENAWQQGASMYVQEFSRVEFHPCSGETSTAVEIACIAVNSAPIRQR